MRTLRAAALLAGLLTAVLPTAGAADDDWDDDFDDVKPAGPVLRDVASLSRGPGLQFRAGHLGFRTFGRHESITPIELFPYVLSDDQLLFSDLRMFVSNRGQLGGNMGFGYRRRVPGWDPILGASLWYDLDDSTGRLFQQTGLSLEAYSDVWDLRSNFYLPVTEKEKDFGFALHDARFAGTGVVFDMTRSYSRALRGVDAEAGLLLPGEFSRRLDLRVYGGGYHFQGGGVPDINGYKARVESHLGPDIRMQVEFTRDRTFGTNVMLGAQWTWAGRFRGTPERPSGDRLGDFVRRNYNVIVARHVRTYHGLVAVNPETGLPWVVRHVDPNGNSDGSIESPFQTLAQAQAAGGDFIFVHAGTVLTESVVLHDGAQVLGEGPGLSYQLPLGFASLTMPSATSGTVRPVIQGPTGDAVTLASNTMLSGFVIDSPSGSGIVGTGLDNVLVRDVDVIGAGGAGVSLTGTAGNVTFRNVNVAGAAGTALHVDGGAGNVRFGGTVANSAGRALVVQNTSGGHVDLVGTTLTDDGGSGVLISGTAGDVTLGPTTVRNSTTTGIDLQGVSGAVTFRDTTTVTASADAGVRIENSPGTTGFESLHVTTAGSTGLHVRNSGRIVTAGGAIQSDGARAVDVEDAEVQVSLTRVSSDGADIGLRLVNAPGQFVVNGSGSLGSGGLIRNAGTGVFLSNVGTVGLGWLDLDQNGTGIQATAATYVGLLVGRVTGSTGAGVDALNVRTLEIGDSTFTGNAGNSIRVQANAAGTWTAALTDNVITDATTDAVLVRTLAGGEGAALKLHVAGNRITTSGPDRDGLRVDWNGGMDVGITNNVFTGTGSQYDGVYLTAGSTTALAQVLIRHNEFHVGGSDSRGIHIQTLGPSDLSIRNNLLNLTGTGGTGMEFSLAQAAQVDLFRNHIHDHISGGTGFRFTSMTGPSQVTFNGNRVLHSVGSAANQGIDFSFINGTITLAGNEDNIVNSATPLLIAPANATTGQFRLNGTLVP